ncbi:MAG: hypothetical protein IH845_01155 [Nanoarchaeota archaeon]|nr:hypothetical protein [Nanoarchaeota archaeon]
MQGEDFSKFNKILIGYILIATLISVIFDFVSSGTGIIGLIVLILYGIFGGYIWYMVIGKYVLMNGDDRDMRGYILLLLPLLILIIVAAVTGRLEGDQRYILAILYGIAFIGICYYRVRQLGYGMFSGSKRLFASDNMGFIIVFVGYILLIFLAIYVFGILGYG